MLRFSSGLFALAVMSFLSSNAMAEDDSLRVISYNIRYKNSSDAENGWEHRMEEMTDFLSEKFDVLGLQEVTAAQLDDLTKRLPEFEVVGVARDDGKRKGEFSPLFIRRERFEILESGTFWLSPTPDKVGVKGWDAALPRVCSWAKVKTKDAAPRELFLACTHFDHIGKEARAESAKLLRSKLSKQASGLPAMLMGDFNCLSKDEPYKLLTSKAGDDAASAWIDAMAITKSPHKGPDSTWNGFKAIVPGQKIDFVFVRGLVVLSHEIRDERIDGRFMSDHLPIIVELK